MEPRASEIVGLSNLLDVRVEYLLLESPPMIKNPVWEAVEHVVGQTELEERLLKQCRKLSEQNRERLTRIATALGDEQ